LSVCVCLCVSMGMIRGNIESLHLQRNVEEIGLKKNLLLRTVLLVTQILIVYSLNKNAYVR